MLYTLPQIIILFEKCTQKMKRKKVGSRYFCDVACLYAEESYLNQLDKNEFRFLPNRKILSLTHTNLHE